MRAVRERERYESSDAGVRSLFIAGLGVAALVAGALALSAWIGRRFERELAPETEVSPLQALRLAPQGPELQAVPGHEIVLHRAREEELLTGTAWVDAVNGIVRIPIARALELTLAEGFPVRPAATAEER